MEGVPPADLHLHLAHERVEDIGAALEHMIYDGLHDQLRGETWN